MVYRESAGVVVCDKNAKVPHYLLLHNAQGHWDFPKGIIEAGESKIEAAARELKEEAGITAAIIDGFEHSFSYFYTEQDGQKAHKTVYFFVGYADSTDIVLSHEHIDCVWLPFKNALQRLPFTESKQLLERADQFLKSLSKNY